jgi:hypothetical protein
MKELSLLGNFFDDLRRFNLYPIYWENILGNSETAFQLSMDLIREIRKIQEEAEKLPKKKEEAGHSKVYSSEISSLYELQRRLNYFIELATSQKAKLSNNPFLALLGAAGTGKTHLLCDVAEMQATKRQPVAMLFGEYFQDGRNLWQQIISQLKLGGEIKTKGELLRLLNNAGKESNVRALILIDALNESAPGVWKKHIESLVAEVKNYPYIGIVVSLRSDFRNETLKEEQFELFVEKEHQGFMFREWEAVTKYFKAFSVPLPAVPLLMPEFQNPLFLLLFCKGFYARKKLKNTKEVFRGHEGATYIFENFVESVADQIAGEFNLPPGKNSKGEYIIWDTVIKKIAEEMVGGRKNKDRISESKLYKIVKKAHPGIDSKKLLKSLEKNLLIARIPSYVKGKQRGADYRFPFQKFSDHLLVRYLLNRYLVKNKSPRKIFAKKAAIGKLISNPFNSGIVEALSIQVPERLKGYDLVDVAPWAKEQYHVQEAFINSIIWRKPSRFANDRSGENICLKYINSTIIKTRDGNDKLLNAFLSIAALPNHPFNSSFLHNHLSRFSMPKRDALWSVFLHYQYGQKGAVDRLIEWAWSDSVKTHISDESIMLASVALVWFLTSSNRFLRDRATKALTSLLTGRISVIVQLFELFKGINDIYVLERLYAIAYGCVLRNCDNNKSIEALAEMIYRDVFEHGKPPVHILLRDYARGMIEAALRKGISLNIDLEKVRPPYESQWPDKIPTEEELKKKYYPVDFFNKKSTDRGYLEIWSSVMNFGDFARYVIGTNSNSFEWTSRKLHEEKQPSREEIYNDFINGLSPEQKNLFDKARVSSIIVNLPEIVDQKDKTKEISKDPENNVEEFHDEFKKTLTEEQIKVYDDVIIPYLTSPRQDEYQFDLRIAQRWIFNRVVQLGWDPGLHGEFDHNISYYRADRSANKPERIGKKYQWIAYHEFLAMVSDNFEYRGDRWSNNDKSYEGPWQLYLRDIDPSCVLKEVPNEKPEVLPSLQKWENAINYSKWQRNHSDKQWLKKTDDLILPNRIIEATDDNNVKWLLLEGFISWEEETDPAYQRYQKPTRRWWYIIKSYIVKREDLDKLYDWTKKQHFMGRWMPESHEFYKVFLGEYPWAQSFIFHNAPYYGHDGWVDDARGTKIPVNILISDDEYQSNGSSFDCSTDEAISIKLPAKWLVDEMGLRQLCVDGRFFDKNSNLIAFDPSIFGASSNRVLLANRNELHNFLKSKGYAILWTILGEKNLIGGKYSGGEWIGRLELSGAYILDAKNKIVGFLNNKFVK